MNLRQIIISAAGGVVTLALIFGVYHFLSNSRKQPEKKVPPKIYRKVSSAIVDYNTVTSAVKSTGRIVSQQSVDVIAEVQGRLMEGDVPLKDGQDFRRGDVLVRLYSKDAAYGLQARKSAYLNALANILPDLKIDFPDDYEAWVEFFKSVEISKDLPELPEVNSDQLKIFLSSRNILSEYYAIKSDEVRLRKYTIEAPYDGAIQNVFLQVGSVANPGSRIAQIIKVSQLEVEVPMEATSASWLKLGDVALLYTEDGNEVGKGRIKRISSFVDETTQSINIYLEIIQNSMRMFPGEYLRVEFDGLTLENAMEIPRNAVFNRNMVFVVQDGYLSKRSVNLLKINETSIIFNGLPEGMEVVTEPMANANENVQVQTEFTTPPPADTTAISQVPENVE